MTERITDKTADQLTVKIRSHLRQYNWFT